MMISYGMGVARTRKEVGLGGGIRARTPRPRALFVYSFEWCRYAVFRARRSRRSYTDFGYGHGQESFFSGYRVAHRQRVRRYIYSDGVGSYSIAEFASMMARQEIAESVEGERTSRS